MKRALHTLFLLLSLGVKAQVPVAPVTDWIASVDSATQKITLSWQPSADTAAIGYHICSGMPCLDYDTVFGRTNTRYVCQDHLPTEPHTYRIHVFDSARNVSSLTPSFGPVVLAGSLDPCANTVTVEWTPYVGLPDGTCSYTLRTPTGSYPLTASPFTFSIDDTVTLLPLLVEMHGSGTGAKHYYSESNRVVLTRMPPDATGLASIVSVGHDSTALCNTLGFAAGVERPYTLWRSRNALDWEPLATLDPLPAEYRDCDLSPRDTSCCYRLSVLDACGRNETFTAEACIALPTPEAPAAYFPNTLVQGDPVNGIFRPALPGLWPPPYDLYIYTRTGIQVFHSDNPGEGWRPDADMPQGVYTYLLRCRFNNNRIRTFRGTILLVK